MKSNFDLPVTRERYSRSPARPCQGKDFAETTAGETKKTEKRMFPPAE